MQVVGCVLSFRENYELVALAINLAVKQFSLQSIQKLVQLRVTFDVVPFFAKSAQLVVVFLQSIDETRFEVGWLADFDGRVSRLPLSNLGDKFLLTVLNHKLGDVEVGRNVD